MENNKVFKKIGEDVRVNELAIISRPELVAPSVSIIGGAPALIIMEDFTNIGSGSRIVCATDDFMQGLISPVVPIEHRTVYNKPVIFKRYATLGVNCTVLPGITLGEGSIVGAGSVVTKDTEPWTVYVGSPAKPIKKRDSKRILESAQKLMNYE